MTIGELKSKRPFEEMDGIDKLICKGLYELDDDVELDDLAYEDDDSDDE